MDRNAPFCKRVQLTILLAMLVQGAAGATETRTEYTRRFLSELNTKLPEWGMQVDQILPASEAGLSVTFSMPETTLLRGMPLLFQVRMENQGAETRRVIALDSGTTGLWLPDLESPPEVPHFLFVDLDRDAFFEAVLGTRHQPFPRLMSFWRPSTVYRELRPSDTLYGEVDLSALMNRLNGTEWHQKPGKYLFQLIWFETISEASVALVADTSFEIVEPTGTDAEALQAISLAVEKYNPTELAPLSPMTSPWEPELEGIAQMYPFSAYTKYIYFLKAWNLESQRMRAVPQGTFAAAASAYWDSVRRYPEFPLTDDALLGYSRCLYLQATEENRDEARDLLTMAKQTLETLATKYPQTNCGPAARQLLERINRALTDVATQK